MAMTTSFMGLRAWNQLLDDYDHDQLADNWAKIDMHDHTPGRGVLLTTESIANNSITLAQTATGPLGLAVGCFMVNTSTQSIAESTFTPVEFTNKAWDVSGWVDVTTHKGRFTPLTEGYYRLTAQTVATTTATAFETNIRKNGTDVLFGLTTPNVSSTSGSAISGLVHANGSTDYFEISVFANKSATLNGSICYFCGELVGRG